MSRSPTSPDPQFLRLIDEGYDVALVDGLLLVRHVPCVGPCGDGVRTGTLAVIASISGDRLVPPRLHSAWWAGPKPCDAGGRPLTGLIAMPDDRMLAPGVRSTYQLCNMPRGREYRDYHEYVTTYVALLGVHAAEIDPQADARVGRHGPACAGAGPFRYADTATSRAGTGAAAARLAGHTVGIVGLGGTGSYVLDLVAKCPVHAIHLYDVDRFEQHNAFRCPGAFGIEELRTGLPKVDILARVYSRLHRRIVPHAIRIDAATAPMLDVLDFAFVCVDDGRARPPILGRLAERGIPFVDVGMGLTMADDHVVGAVRTTLAGPERHAAAMTRIPDRGDPDGAYASNVQVADLNALNAALAVIAWKRSRGFYLTSGAADHSVFVVETGALHRERV